ncbi:MAG: ABC transporter substrate-binding protein [Mariprofundales bacterium]
MFFIRIFFLFLISYLLLSCSSPNSAPNELRIGLAQSVISLDPRFATDSASVRVQTLIHRGLTRMDTNFQAVPDIAQHWQHPDPYTWLFTLKNNIQFNNAQVVTASDVVATLESILNPKTASPLRAGFSAIKSIKKIDASHIMIRLHKPDNALLTRLSIGILPESLVKNKNKSRNNMIGCGTFSLQSWTDDALVLKRTKIISTISVATKKNVNIIQVIRLLTIKDPVTRSLKLESGAIDLIQNDLPPHLLPYISQLPQVQVTQHASTTFSYLGMNLQDPLLSQLAVRQALALAIDRLKIKKTLLADLPSLAETVLSPQHWAYNHNLPATPFNPKKAMQLLDEAGLPANEEGIRMSLVYRTSTDPVRLRLANAIADQWRAIGVKTSIESLEWGAFYARIKRGDFQVYSLSWTGIQDADIYRWILHSDMQPPHGANRGRYNKPEVDHWLDAAAATQNDIQRQRLYADIQQTMHAEQVYIPLWYEPVIAVQGPRLRGFRPNANGTFRSLAQAWLLY